jgi:CheY-like chemotaxis protein
MEEALPALTPTNVDIVLMELGLPGILGIEGIRTIKARHPTMKLVAVTVTRTMTASSRPCARAPRDSAIASLPAPTPTRSGDCRGVLPVAQCGGCGRERAVWRYYRLDFATTPVFRPHRPTTLITNQTVMPTENTVAVAD